MVSFTLVILLVTQLAAPVSPYVLIVERGAETLIGAIVGIVVPISAGHGGYENLDAGRGGSDPAEQRVVPG